MNGRVRRREWDPLLLQEELLIVETGWDLLGRVLLVQRDELWVRSFRLDYTLGDSLFFSQGSFQVELHGSSCFGHSWSRRYLSEVYLKLNYSVKVRIFVILEFFSVFRSRKLYFIRFEIYDC